MIPQETIDNLIGRAKLASHQAYSPYSKIKFGCALLCEDGAVFTGANIENSSYGATICAERTAIFKAVSEGHCKFKYLVLYYSQDVTGQTITPCGLCRQVMSEFCKDLEILMVQGSRQTIYHLAEIFTVPFDTQVMTFFQNK